MVKCMWGRPVIYQRDGEVGSIRYWALKIGKSHSALSYRLKTHGIDNLKKYIEQRIKLV